MPKTKGLTDKQAMFVQEYLVDFNATQAAIRAGYSKHTANIIGPENLSKLCIQDAVREATKKRNDRTKIDQDYVVEKSAAIVEDSMAEESRFADAGNANKALQLLSKYTGGFSDKLDVQGDISINVNTGMEATPGSGAG